jgi:hypothetical protein
MELRHSQLFIHNLYKSFKLECFQCMIKFMVLVIHKLKFKLIVKLELIKQRIIMGHMIIKPLELIKQIIIMELIKQIIIKEHMTFIIMEHMTFIRLPFIIMGHMIIKRILSLVRSSTFSFIKLKNFFIK